MQVPRWTRLPLAALLLALLVAGGSLLAAAEVTSFPVAVRGMGAVMVTLGFVGVALVAGGPLSAPSSEGG